MCLFSTNSKETIIWKNKTVIDFKHHSGLAEKCYCALACTITQDSITKQNFYIPTIVIHFTMLVQQIYIITFNTLTFRPYLKMMF